MTAECCHFQCTGKVPPNLSTEEAAKLAFETCTYVLDMYGHKLVLVIQRDNDGVGDLLVIATRGETSVLQCIRDAANQLGTPCPPLFECATSNLAFGSCMETFKNCADNLALAIGGSGLVAVVRGKEIVAVIYRHLELHCERMTDDDPVAVPPNCSPQHEHWYSL